MGQVGGIEQGLAIGGDPAVVATVRDGDCLLDLRCVPVSEDERLVRAVTTARAVLAQTPR